MRISDWSSDVCSSDLVFRGYGDSEKLPGDAAHANYSKRAMAADQVATMAALGFDRFDVVAHDRGARVAHRMALDHPDRIARLVLLDIAPTATMYAQTNREFRSVEHTTELQSLMRLTYAALCL